MECAWSKLSKVNFLRPCTLDLKIHYIKIKIGKDKVFQNSKWRWPKWRHVAKKFIRFSFYARNVEKLHKNASVSIKCYLWLFVGSLITNLYVNFQIQYGGSKAEDGIFKNAGRISTKCPPTGFRGRRLRIYCQICKIQNSGSKMADEIFKNNGKVSTNVHLRVFGVADYEFIVIFMKFNMADSRWWITFCKNTVKSD